MCVCEREREIQGTLLSYTCIVYCVCSFHFFAFLPPPFYIYTMYFHVHVHVQMYVQCIYLYSCQECATVLSQPDIQCGNSLSETAATVQVLMCLPHLFRPLTQETNRTSRTSTYMYMYMCAPYIYMYVYNYCLAIHSSPGIECSGGVTSKSRRNNSQVR